MASIKIYDKEQVDNLMSGKADVADLPSTDELVPDTTGASEGDVLTLNNNLQPQWAAGGSGGITAHTYSSWSDFIADMESHPHSLISMLATVYNTNAREFTFSLHPVLLKAKSPGQSTYNYFLIESCGGGTSSNYFYEMAITASTTSASLTINYWASGSNTSSTLGSTSITIDRIVAYY